MDIIKLHWQSSNMIRYFTFLILFRRTRLASFQLYLMVLTFVFNRWDLYYRQYIVIKIKNNNVWNVYNDVVCIGHGFDLTHRGSLFSPHHNSSSETATVGSVVQKRIFTFSFYQVHSLDCGRSALYSLNRQLYSPLKMVEEKKQKT